jgi:hypothetical protein
MAGERGAKRLFWRRPLLARICTLILLSAASSGVSVAATATNTAESVTDRPTPATADRIAESWRALRVERPAPASVAELRSIELLMARSLDRPWDQATERAWQARGFTTRAISLRGDPCHAVGESDDQRRGRGYFVFCPTRSDAGLLLVPHAFADRLTGEIAAWLTVEGRFRGVAWNTAHRAASAHDGHESPPARIDDEDESLGAHADLAHAEESHFTALTRAAVVVGVSGPVVQLHGFAVHRRKSEAGRRARAILSAGSMAPQHHVRAATRCLVEALGEGFMAYPKDVDELGGTRNRLGELLRRWGRRDFLHVELSHALRLRLVAQPEVRSTLLECLGGHAS